MSSNDGDISFTMPAELEEKLDEVETTDESAEVGTEATQTTPFASRVQRTQPVQQRIVGTKVGRNDPCPCGSGKKYKKCCWSKDQRSNVAG